MKRPSVNKVAKDRLVRESCWVKKSNISYYDFCDAKKCRNTLHLTSRIRRVRISSRA